MRAAHCRDGTPDRGSQARLLRSRALAVCVLAVLATAGVGTPASAQAEDLVVVALGGNASEAQRAPVLAETVRRFAAEGFTVLGPAELVHRVPPSRLALRTTEEAVRLAADLGATRVACVSVWVEGEAVRELSMSLHAVSGGRSVRESTATGATSDVASVEATLATMVAHVLARERDAVLLDPGATLGSATGSGMDTDTYTGSGSDSGSGVRAGTGSGIPRPPASDPLFGILGPGLLAAIGAAGIGLGVWATLDPTCNLRAPSGTCLRGEDNNVGLGILFIATGTLSLAGAIIWWITGATAPPTEPRIDVVVGPGSAGVRGTF